MQIAMKAVGPPRPPGQQRSHRPQERIDAIDQKCWQIAVCPVERIVGVQQRLRDDAAAFHIDPGAGGIAGISPSTQPRHPFGHAGPQLDGSSGRSLRIVEIERVGCVEHCRSDLAERFVWQVRHESQVGFERCIVGVQQPLGEQGVEVQVPVVWLATDLDIGR